MAINSDWVRAQSYFQGEVGRSALVNKLGIKDQRLLEKAEALYAELAIAQGLPKAALALTPKGLKLMHKAMFDEVYEWAGEYRDYTTGRGLPFCVPDYIESSLNKLYQQLNQQLDNIINHDMSHEELIKAVAFFMGELNAVHPFIDGNGRTQRMVLAIIAQKAGYYIDVTGLNQKDWYAAAADAHELANYQGFEAIFESVLVKVS